MEFYASPPIGLGDGEHEASNEHCCSAPTSSFSFEINLGSISNDDAENNGPLSPLSNASNIRKAASKCETTSNNQFHMKQLVLLADGVQTLKKAKEELERENEKLRSTAKSEQSELLRQISALEEKILVLNTKSENAHESEPTYQNLKDDDATKSPNAPTQVATTISDDLLTPEQNDARSSPQHEGVTEDKDSAMSQEENIVDKCPDVKEKEEVPDLSSQTDISCGSKSVDTILMRQNENIMEQAALIEQITECEAGLKTSWSILQEQLEEKEQTIDNMKLENEKLKDMLQAQKLAESEANYKLLESEDDREKLIKKNKDLEVVVADKNFLVAELGKELEVSHRMQDSWRKKVDEQKQRLKDQHEREIASLCKNRMIEVEKRVTDEVNRSMKAKHVAEISLLMKEMRELKEQAKELQLHMSDESFQKGEALRQLKDLSYKYEDLQKEKEMAEEARRKELEPMVIAMKHDVEMELKRKYDEKVNTLEDMLEEQINKVRDLKVKQFDTPEEVLTLRRELHEAKEKLSLMTVNEDTVTVHSGNCVTELTASLEEIKNSVFFSDRRLEEMTMPAINEAKAKIRESISKMDEALRMFCIVDEISREKDCQGGALRDRTVSISSVKVPNQNKGATFSALKEDNEVSLNSLTREWKEYHDARGREEDAKKSLIQKEAEHLVRQLRDKTFLLDCVDI